MLELNVPEAPQAQQRVVGHGLYLVPLQVEVGEVLHAPDGSGDPPEVVLEAEQLPQSRLLYEDAVGDAEEVTVRQVQAPQLLQTRERPRVKVADVLVVRHFQLHQAGEALRDTGTCWRKWTKLTSDAFHENYRFQI